MPEFRRPFLIFLHADSKFAQIRGERFNIGTPLRALTVERLKQRVDGAPARGPADLFLSQLRQQDMKNAPNP
jgi:hypothetical protein